MVGHWGYHLILDCANADHELISSRNNIYDFTKVLVKEIDMVSFGEPQIVLFGSGNKAGYTLVQLIETSNICAHFVEENDTIYFDIFSCKPFDVDKAKMLVEKWFGCNITKCRYLERLA